MDSQLAISVLVRGPGEGPATWAMGSLFERLASGDETGRRCSGMSLITQPPGTATPLHVHSREAEAFYLLEGTLTYQAGGELHHLAARVVHLPPAQCAARVPRHRDDSSAVPRIGCSRRPDDPVRRGGHPGARTKAARAGRPAHGGRDHALERDRPEVRPQRSAAARPTDRAPGDDHDLRRADGRPSADLAQPPGPPRRAAVPRSSGSPGRPGRDPGRPGRGPGPARARRPAPPRRAERDFRARGRVRAGEETQERLRRVQQLRLGLVRAARWRGPRPSRARPARRRR